MSPADFANALPSALFSRRSEQNEVYASLDGGRTNSWIGIAASVLAGALVFAARGAPGSGHRVSAATIRRVACSSEASQRAAASRGTGRPLGPGLAALGSW